MGPECGTSVSSAYAGASRTRNYEGQPNATVARRQVSPSLRSLAFGSARRQLVRYFLNHSIVAVHAFWACAALYAVWFVSLWNACPTPG